MGLRLKWNYEKKRKKGERGEGRVDAIYCSTSTLNCMSVLCLLIIIAVLH